MRIIGIGVDLLATARIDALISRRGIAPFAKRILSSREAMLLEESLDKAAFLHSRFAVKEALFKATSAHRRLAWGEVSLVKLPDGRPEIIFEKDNDLHAHVSISHDQGFLIAMVMVMAKIN